MTYNGVVYLMFVLRRETRFGFVKALSFKRSERIREAMLDMQSLLRGVWRFHGDEGREFMGAVELAEKNVLSFTPQPTPTIETRTVSSKKVLFDVFCIKQTHLCVRGLMQRNTQTKSSTTANDWYLDRTTKWNRSCCSGVPFRTSRM